MTTLKQLLAKRSHESQGRIAAHAAEIRQEITRKTPGGTAFARPTLRYSTRCQ